MARDRTFTVTLTNIPCSCGGTLRPFRGEGEYDASIELGLPALVTGTWMALKCDKCGELSLPAPLIEELSNDAVLLVLKLNRRMSGLEAKFVRKAGLGLRQEELATRLGVSRPTVARWEAENSVSADHDFQLRNFAALALLKKSQQKPGSWAKRRSQILDLIAHHLDAARSTEAPFPVPPLALERRAA